MWRFLQSLFQRKSAPVITYHRTIDYTKPHRNHWLDYRGGDPYGASFDVRGPVARGNDVLVRMRSGRIGRFTVYSVRKDFTGMADWKATGAFICYEPAPATEHRPIKGLLGDGTGSVRSDKSKPALLSSGFTEPSSEFWEVLCRDEARHSWADPVRATGRLRFGW